MNHVAGLLLDTASVTGLLLRLVHRRVHRAVVVDLLLLSRLTENWCSCRSSRTLHGRIHARRRCWTDSNVVVVDWTRY